MIKQTTVTAGSRRCLVVTLGLNPGQRCLHANPGIELDVGSSFEALICRLAERPSPDGRPATPQASGCGLRPTAYPAAARCSAPI